MTVANSGFPSVNAVYQQQSARVIPKGFAAVCMQQQWDVQRTWDKLNGGRDWWSADNGSYLYLNVMDGKWWLDEPGGNGVYIAPAEGRMPPARGWQPLAPQALPLPQVSVGEHTPL